MVDYSPISNAITQRAFTKQLLGSLIQQVVSAPPPSAIIVSSYVYSTFTVFNTASAEQWDWRRTKRELSRIGLVRKGVRREYHKRAA